MPATQTTQNHVCAECKRLKLKCDKNVPCSSCVRRGCPSICPDGRLVAGKGTRFVLSNTQELHEKIESLQVRIKDLESALAQLQSTFTTEPHPLLVKPHRATTEHSKLDEGTSKDNEPDGEDLVDNFGSLTIDTEGETVWYGSHAGSEFLIPRKEADTNSNADLDLPIDIILLSRLFPFKHVHEAEDVVRNLVRSHLPSRNVAYEATYSVYRRLSWATSPVVWEEFCRTIFDPIYSPGNVANDQQVAIFFISMALHVLGDPKHSMYHPDARRYYHLSRVSMSLGEDILQSHTVYAVQYLELFSTFNIIIDDPAGPDRAWGALGLAIRLAQMAGLHRDNEQWSKYPEQAERRRRIWWDLVLYETIHGFAMGRPRAIYPAHYNTKMPKDSEDEGKTPSFARVEYRWVAGCLGSVLDEAFAVKPPPYPSILKLDKTLRDWNFAGVPSLSHLMKGEDSEIGAEVLLRSLSTTGLREIALMYLHRRYFVEALATRPYEPLNSKYAMSVLAVHHSSILLLHGISRSSHTVEQVFARMCFMWVHALSAYVCLSAIVIKSPGCSLAPSSLTEIDRIKDTLTGVKTYRVLHAQPTIIKLHEQAHLAMNKYNEGKWPRNGSVDGADEDVMKFIGRADFAPAKQQEVTVKVTTEKPFEDEAHSMLFEYMKQFETQPEKPTGTPTSTLHFIPGNGIFSYDMPGLGNSIGSFDSHNPNRPLEQVDIVNHLGLSSESATTTSQTTHSTGWPSSSHQDKSHTLAPIQGDSSNIPSQDFLFQNLLLDQGTGLGQTNQQPSQDQIWEQFLSSLMS